MFTVFSYFAFTKRFVSVLVKVEDRICIWDDAALPPSHENARFFVVSRGWRRQRT